MSEPEGYQGEVPDHGVSRARRIHTRLESRDLYPVAVNIHAGGKKFIVSLRRGISGGNQSVSSFHARANRVLNMLARTALMTGESIRFQHSDAITPARKQDQVFKVN